MKFKPTPRKAQLFAIKMKDKDEQAGYNYRKLLKAARKFNKQQYKLLKNKQNEL